MSNPLAGGFLFLGVPMMAIAWPIITLALSGQELWHPWGVGGCLVFAAILIPLGTYTIGALPHDDTPLSLVIGVPLWLLGSLNAIAAAGFWVGFYSNWRLRVRLAVPVVIVALTWVGKVVVTWPGLPDPASPQDGQLTGVVGEVTAYGWRQQVGSSYEIVVAVPATAFNDFMALHIRDNARGFAGQRPPLRGPVILRDGLSEVAGLSHGVIENDGAFVVDGLFPQIDYWICMGSTPPRRELWEFDVCDRPDVAIPGQLRVRYSPQGSRIAPWPQRMRRTCGMRAPPSGARLLRSDRLDDRTDLQRGCRGRAEDGKRYSAGTAWVEFR